MTEADVLAVDVHLADMRQLQIAAAGDLTVGRMQLAEAVGLPLTDVILPVRPASRPIPADELVGFARLGVLVFPNYRLAIIIIAVLVAIGL